MYGRKSSYCPGINRSSVTKLEDITLIGNLEKDLAEAIVLYN